jgi:hypothetical protein
MRRTLAEIRACAREELAVNPTITVYTFIGGVEKRRPAHPFAKLNAACRSMTASFNRMGDSLAGVRAEFDKIIDAEVNR